MPLLPPEARLLFLATRPGAASVDPSLARLMQTVRSWEAVGRLAEREKLLPVMWSRLRHHTQAIPAETAALLHRQAVVTEFRMALTESVLREVVRQLAAEGIRVILLKGAALATTVYPSFAHRPMGDLDILVAPEETERAWRRLRDAGWTLEYEVGEELYETHQHLLPLVDPKGLRIVLEIHRAMLPPQGPFVLDEAEIWRDARPVKLGATPVWVPSDRHQLLHLCIHFAWSHMLRGVGRTVRDVATLLEARPMDWPAFVELATRTRAQSCAFWTLAMSQTLAGASIPGGVLAGLRPHQPQLVTHALERIYVMSSLLGACPSIRLTQLFWSAGVRPRASGHGDCRPWVAGDLFARAKLPGWRPTVVERLVAHAGRVPEWLRFAGVVGSRRRIL
jgi:hypothetical protein